MSVKGSSGGSVDRWVHRTADGVEWGGKLPKGRPAGIMESFAEALAVTWRTRETLWVLVVNDFKGRYRAQSFGMFWAFAQPLVMMVTITVAFQYILRIPIPNFPVFFLIAMIHWQFFGATISSATECLMGSALVKQTNFPRFLVPVASILSHLINLALETVLLFGFYFVFPNAYNLNYTLIGLPVLILLLVMMVIGLGLMTSVFNVRFRDLRYIVGSVLTVGFWVSPILFSTSMAPPWLAPILRLNPLSGVFDGARDIIMLGRWPEPSYLIPTIVAAVVLFVTGCLVFRRQNLTVADFT